MKRWIGLVWLALAAWAASGPNLTPTVPLPQLPSPPPASTSTLPSDLYISLSLAQPDHSLGIGLGITGLPLDLSPRVGLLVGTTSFITLDLLHLNPIFFGLLTPYTGLGLRIEVPQGTRFLEGMAGLWLRPIPSLGVFAELNPYFVPGLSLALSLRIGFSLGV
jgi:hypothetical protein